MSRCFYFLKAENFKEKVHYRAFLWHFRIFLTKSHTAAHMYVALYIKETHLDKLFQIYQVLFWGCTKIRENAPP